MEELIRNKNLQKEASKKSGNSYRYHGKPFHQYHLSVLIDRTHGEHAESDPVSTHEIKNLGKPTSWPKASQKMAVFSGDNGTLVEKTDWPYREQTLMSGKALQQFVSDGLPTESPCFQFLEFWDHGMGPFGFGDSYSKDDEPLTLSLKDISSAIAKTYESRVVTADNYRRQRKYDIIGFDACLMSAFEVAYELHPYAQYLLASEETEPGHYGHQ